MTMTFLARITRRMGRAFAVIIYFFFPGCDSPPRYQGVGTNDDHPTSPVPAPPAHPNNTEP